jgi:hypothetical protein
MSNSSFPPRIDAQEFVDQLLRQKAMVHQDTVKTNSATKKKMAP